MPAARTLTPAALAMSWLAAFAQANRQFTIKNSCDYTIWPAVTTYSGPSYTGVRGWEAAAGSTKSITIPSTWNGRVWSRRGCSFDSSGAGSCASGDSGGGLEPTDGTAGNANLIELNLNAGGVDYTDISAVPGFTTPVAFTAEGCGGPSCSQDLTAACPSSQLEQKDADGNVVGCLSACMALYNGLDPSDSVDCCSGQYSTREACLSSDVDFYSFFKDGCTNAYAFPFDDDSGYSQVVYTCDSSTDPGYDIEFCPSGSSSGNSTASGAVSGSAPAPTTPGASSITAVTSSPATPAITTAASTAESGLANVVVASTGGAAIDTLASSSTATIATSTTAAHVTSPVASTKANTARIVKSTTSRKHIKVNRKTKSKAKVHHLKAHHRHRHYHRKQSEHRHKQHRERETDH